jgi:hypothetical protein
LVTYGRTLGTGFDEIKLSIGTQRAVSLQIKFENVMEELVPTEYQLSQNYPNPFKEKTEIKYCLPEKVKVKLEVFDAEKRKVKTLVDEVEEAGTYKVELTGEDLMEGVYFYKIKAGEFVSTKKMVLLK